MKKLLNVLLLLAGIFFIGLFTYLYFEKSEIKIVLIIIGIIVCSIAIKLLFLQNKNEKEDQKDVLFDEQYFLSIINAFLYIKRIQINHDKDKDPDFQELEVDTVREVDEIRRKFKLGDDFDFHELKVDEEEMNTLLNSLKRGMSLVCSPVIIKEFMGQEKAMYSQFKKLFVVDGLGGR